MAGLCIYAVHGCRRKVRPGELYCWRHFYGAWLFRYRHWKFCKYLEKSERKVKSGVASLFLQSHWNLIAAEDWQKHKWQWIGSIVIPVVLVVAVHIMWRLLLAPSRIYGEQENKYSQELGEYKEQVNALSRRIEELSSIAPQIEIFLGPIIEKGALKEGVTDLFMVIDLKLIEPAQRCSQDTHSAWDDAIKDAEEEIQLLRRQKARLEQAIRIFKANKKDGVCWPVKSGFPQAEH